MHLKSFSIQNFQSHGTSALEFSPHLNVIIGPTNSGKSAIVRALKKVFIDSPRGTGFVTADKTDCVLTLNLDNGAPVVRVIKTRDGNLMHNEYRLNGKTFFNFGTDIPDEIANALSNYQALLIEELDDIRFGNQLDPPFLLTLTPSSRARILSRISGVDVLDRGAQIANREAKSQSRELNDLSQEIAQIEAELLRFKDLPTWEQQLVLLKGCLTQIEERVSKRRTVIATFQNFQVLERQWGALKTFLITKGKSSTEQLFIKEKIQSLEDKVNLQKRVQNVCIRLQSITLQQKTLHDFVLLSMGFDFKKVLSTLEEKSLLLQGLLILQSKYRTLASTYEAAKGSLATISENFAQAVEELTNLQIELKVCPTCGKPW